MLIVLCIIILGLVLSFVGLLLRLIFGFAGMLIGFRVGSMFTLLLIAALCYLAVRALAFV